ncbi:MAG TPA: hypothetical protein IAB11_01015 [Candidatus Ornithoclostridium faecavium]|nr:hypothetical protein [Candidatus Ornithoclostridium faecavium]
MKGKKFHKKTVTAFNMYFFARAVACCFRYDDDFKKYVGMLPEKFVFRMRVLPDGNAMTIVKNGEKLTVGSGREMIVKPDVDVCFKNVEGALSFFTGVKSFSKCLAQSAFVIYGDVSGMMTVSHMFDIVASYMLFKSWLKKYDRALLPRTANVHKIRFFTLFGRF